MSASAHRYTCDELGACQSRANPCAGCSQRSQAHPFAPGVIERHAKGHRPLIATLRKLRRALGWSLLVFAPLAIAGLIAVHIFGA